MIRKKLIPEEYYNGCKNCPDCSMILKQDSPSIYNKKWEQLKFLRRKAEEAAVNKDYCSQLLKEEDIRGYSALLGEDGCFSDLGEDAADASVAIERLALMANPYHKSQNTIWPLSLKIKVLKSAAHYCKIEADRENHGNVRFHESIFHFPACALNLFFILLDDMEMFEAYEAGEIRTIPDVQEEILKEAYEQILRVALQTFTLPLRNDHTDNHPISIERFRKHVWWVGGNAIGYRRTLYAALALQSVEMMDVLVEVSKRCFSPVSAATVEYAFWSEGICADGLGWGHGRQAYSTGYAFDGVKGALNILEFVKGTVWDEKPDYFWLLHFMRGMSWVSYRGHMAPMQGRTIFWKDSGKRRKPRPTPEECVRTIARKLYDDFENRLTDEELNEVTAILQSEYTDDMVAPDGWYTGVRGFYNNDAFVVKRPHLYLYVNMASARTNGVEFAAQMADKRNYFFGDGSYVLMTDGEEYEESRGTWRVSHLPGVTERDLTNEELQPETNWSGYHSIHNFAAIVCRGNDGAAGFWYEKDMTRKKDGAGVLRNDYTKEMGGVFAAKAYFVVGDTMVCLGAGITDKNPEYGHDVVTTINNTLQKGEPQQITCPDKNHMYYVVHGGVLYGIYEREGNCLSLKAENRKTHWMELNIDNAKIEDVDVPIFELGINHGKAPKDAGYEYYMYCGTDKPEDYVKRQEPVILTNRKDAQAVANQDFTYVAAVCYESNAVVSAQGMYLSMDYPGAVMLQRDGEDVYLTVCDGIQTEGCREIIVTYCFPDENENHTKTIALPQDELTGKEMTVKIK